MAIYKSIRTLQIQNYEAEKDYKDGHKTIKEKVLAINSRAKTLYLKLGNKTRIKALLMLNPLQSVFLLHKIDIHSVISFYPAFMVQ